MANMLSYVREGHYFNGRNGRRVVPMGFPFKQRFNEFEHAYSLMTPNAALQRRGERSETRPLEALVGRQRASECRSFLDELNTALVFVQVSINE